MPLDNNELAAQRTFLAHERTLMAWIRTSTTLISFGFTVYKFFEYLIETKQGLPVAHLFGPREYALGMITIGVTVLAVAVVQYRRSLKLMDLESVARYPMLADKLAAVISFMGLCLLIIVLLRR